MPVIELVGGPLDGGIIAVPDLLPGDYLGVATGDRVAWTGGNHPSALETLYATGCRASEVTSLRPADISFGREAGYVLKLLAIAQRTPEGLDVRVHPAFIPSASPSLNSFWALPRFLASFGSCEPPNTSSRCLSWAVTGRT